jgi:hemerythrin superfamily protein
VEDVHGHFREAFKQVLQASKPGHVYIKGFNQVNRSLQGHHGNEDRSWFPRLKRLHPEMVKEIDVLERDHKYLVNLEHNIVEKNDYDSLVEFVEALNDHLNREEMISVPFLCDGTGGLG